MNLNRVELIGRLTKQPELRQTPTGKKVATASLATSSPYKDQQGNWQDGTSEFHNLVAWEKTGELLNTVAKGQELFVVGKLTTRKWEDKNGVTRYTTEIIVQGLVPGRMPKGKSAPADPVAAAQEVFPDAEPVDELPTIQAGGEDVNVEDIPF